MRSVRCDVCGTKALMAASQCPKCSHPLAFRDGFGEILPLAHCPTCDSDYPLHQGACKWCGTAPAKTTVGPNIWKYVGIGAFVSMGVGAWLARGEEPPTKSVLLASSEDSASAARAATNTGPSQSTFARPESLVTDAASLGDSTPVVIVDSLRRDSVTSAMVTLESAGVIVDTTQVVAAPTESLDSAPTNVDSAPTVDSARVRDPWLPPPSVIRRTPPSVTTQTAVTTTASPESVAPPAPPVAAAHPSPAPSTTRVAVAPPTAEKRSAPAAAASPSRAKPKASSKVVAKAPPKRTTSRVATGSTSATPRKVAPAPRTTAAAKPPAATSRRSTGWVNSVSRGWAVVRASANGRARIIGSVGPDTRVQLGETRGGFRRIKARGLAGWVDTRAYFVAAPRPKRSGRLASQ